MSRGARVGGGWVHEKKGEPRFGVKPPVRNEGYVVIRRDRFQHGVGDRDAVFILGVSWRSWKVSWKKTTPTRM